MEVIRMYMEDYLLEVIQKVYEDQAKFTLSYTEEGEAVPEYEMEALEEIYTLKRVIEAYKDLPEDEKRKFIDRMVSLIWIDNPNLIDDMLDSIREFTEEL